jgi:hypothetical protein
MSDDDDLKLRHTRISPRLWSWQPWVSLPTVHARLLWLALYTTPEAKRMPAGLWHGGIGALAEAATMGADDVISSVSTLLDRRLIEYDKANRVIRLTELPDRGERPHNGSVIRGWWTSFKSVPQCAVRDAHVPFLAWLAEPFTNDHQRAWDDTFATVKTPKGRVGTRSVTDPTSERQPDLFQVNSGSPDTVSDTVSDTVWDPGSGIRDQGSGSEREGGGKKPPLPFTVAELLAALDESSGGRFRGTGPFDRRLGSPITAVIRELDAQGLGMDDVRQVGQWLASGGMSFRDDLGPLWLAKTGNLIDAIAQARMVPSAPTVKPRPVLRLVAPAPAPEPAAPGGRRKL